jgi:hypothetical protein
MADAITPLNADQVIAEEQSRAQLAKALTDRTERFNQQAPPVVATPEPPKTPLAAALAALSAPAPIAPPRDLNATRAQLDPLLKKARELMRKYDELKSEIGDRAADYSMLDMARIVKILPPTTDSLNWSRLTSLVNAAKEITGTFMANNYSEMSRLVGVIQMFADGAITEYQDQNDRSRALYNPGVATRYMTDQVKKFEVTVGALVNNLKTITLMEPLIAADLVLVQAAPVVPEVAPERMPMHQKLPNERPTSYHTDFDPREPAPQPDTSVKVERIADGFHTTTTERRAQ